MALSKIETNSLDVGRFGGRRNMLINGDCSVWQRGTSHTSGGLSYYSIDRWWTYNANGTFQRSTTVPAGEGFAYSMNMAGTWNSLGQPIELPAQGVTMLKPNTDYCISFWVKGATTTTTPYVAHRYRDQKGSGAGNTNIDGGITNYIITPEWQRIAIVFNTGTTVPASTNNILDIEFAGWGATQTDTYLTGFQLEEGSTPSPFEHTLPGEQLALCQRYFHRIDRANTGSNTFITGCVTPSAGIFYLQFPNTMRSAPSVIKTGTNYSMYSVSNGAQVSLNNFGVTFGPFGKLGGRFLTAKVGDAGNSAWLDLNNDDTHISFDAEL